MQVNRCFGCMEETTSNLCPYCGNDQQKQNIPEYVLQPGAILYGKYLIGNVLGQGGFGVTYIGWDLALNRIVAIKEYSLPHMFPEMRKSVRNFSGIIQSDPGKPRAWVWKCS